MISAEVLQGDLLETPLQALLARPEVALVHLRFARPGCFACRIDRV